MKSRLVRFVLLALILSSSLALSAGESQDEFFARRFGLFIGANKGGPGRVTLRFAQEDARAVKAVLEEMGGLMSGDSTLLTQPTREAFFREMKDLGRRVTQAKSQFRRVEAVIYYSGHSDEEAILLDGERVSYEEFREAVTSIAADVRIAILDSCASGSFTQAKGVRQRAPFLMDTAYDMRGYAFMTSSSADEASQESKRLRGSFFTHNLISGMRGAADMNLDGRITLTEAYQFAFDNTLEQTEKTTGGPQHPNYNIQMSGKGDVIITDIGRSDELLLIKSDIGGKVYIHNRSNVLVVELSKPLGREISLGLGQGDYRLILIAEGFISEARISLKKGKTQSIGRERFERVEKIPATARGQYVPAIEELGKRRLGRWQFDLFGGAAIMDPEDLNLRAETDEEAIYFNLNTKYSYLRQTGEVTFFTSNIQGGLRPLRTSLPWGFRLRRSINDGLAVSVGLMGFWGSRVSSYKHNISVVEAGGSQYVYLVNITDFTLAAKGLAPVVGLHLGKNLTPRLRLEAHVGGGPLFAECRHSQKSEEAPMSDLGEYYEVPYNGRMEEKGKGTGLAVTAGLGLHVALGPRFGLFLETNYAWQRVNEVSGPGSIVDNEGTLSWEDTWAIKSFSKVRDWGSLSIIYPSNYWPLEHLWRWERAFKLDLSGAQVRIGFSYRL